MQPRYSYDDRLPSSELRPFDLESSLPQRKSDQSVGAAELRAHNEGLLLRTIWQKRTISRADLARQTGLSRSSVSTIVSDLLDTSLVETLGVGSSNGGRRPILLGFKDDAYYIVGVDVGATHIGLALTDLRGSVVEWRQRPADGRSDPEGTIATTRSLIDSVLANHGLGAHQLVGIGLSMPSPVVPDSPNRLSPVVLPAWKGTSPIEELEAYYRRPVRMDNDANLGALAEHWWGKWRTNGNLTWIKVATGVGAGIILEGRVYRGHNGVAGEIGHMSIDPEGPLCVCGLRGCLNTLVGTSAVLGAIETGLADSPKSALSAAPAPSIHRLVDAALSGDELARQILRRTGQTLGVAVANLIHLINPAAVVLGGGIVRAGDLLLDAVRETARAHVPFDASDECPIVPSALGQPSVGLGAATLILQEALSNPDLFPKRAAVAAGVSVQ